MNIVDILTQQPPGDKLELLTATVVRVRTSPNLVDVLLNGATTTTQGLHYWASYTPTVGDVVRIIRKGSDAEVVAKFA